MARKAEQVATPTIAGEGERATSPLAGEAVFQISRGGLSVPNLKLHRGPNGHSVTYRQCP